MDISKAKVLITGGGSGIGYEIAKVLKDKGAQVVICGRTESKITQAAQELGVIGIQADVSQEADVKRLVASAIQKMDGLNVLINNAGIIQMSPLISTDTEAFTKVWETNVRGLFMVGKEVAQHFVNENTGNIINISSSAGLKGFAGGTAYVASKFAVTGMTECWRAELRKNNIRVMQINPSEVVTPLGADMGWQRTNIDSKLKPSEIAHVAENMLSMNDVGFITDATVWATNPQ